MRAFLIAVFVAAFALVGQAGAHTGKGPQMRPHSQRLTLVQLERRQATNLHRARSVLHFFRSRNLATGAGLPPRARTSYRWAYAAAEKPAWLVRELGETRAAIRTRAAPSWQREPVRHLALWLCIHGGEGAWGAVGRGIAAGHYNGLQMTWGWGPLEGDPNGYRPAQILAAAEYEYRQSGYSSTWLAGQWGQTISPCWQYA
jgi:hypothetical protein